MNPTIDEYELTDEQWSRVEVVINKKLGKNGRYNANDNRVFVNACLWIVRTDAPWRALPERYGKFTAVNRRYKRWCEKGIWEDILAEIIDDPSMEWLIIERRPVVVNAFLPAGFRHDILVPNTKVTLRWMRLICHSDALSQKIQHTIAKNHL